MMKYWLYPLFASVFILLSCQKETVKNADNENNVFNAFLQSQFPQKYDPSVKGCPNRDTDFKFGWTTLQQLREDSCKYSNLRHSQTYFYSKEFDIELLPFCLNSDCGNLSTSDVGLFCDCRVIWHDMRRNKFYINKKGYFPKLNHITSILTTSRHLANNKKLVKRDLNNKTNSDEILSKILTDRYPHSAIPLDTFERFIRLIHPDFELATPKDIKNVYELLKNTSHTYFSSPAYADLLNFDKKEIAYLYERAKEAPSKHRYFLVLFNKQNKIIAYDLTTLWVGNPTCSEGRRAHHVHQTLHPVTDFQNVAEPKTSSLW